MKTIVVKASTGYVGCQIETEIQVEDDVTEEEINKLAFDAMLEEIEWYWIEKNNTEK
jgi:hypothetical protein